VYVIRVWDLETGACQSTLRVHGNCAMYASLAPDGTHLVTSGEGPGLHLWDTTSPKPLAAWTADDLAHVARGATESAESACTWDFLATAVAHRLGIPVPPPEPLPTVCAACGAPLPPRPPPPEPAPVVAARAAAPYRLHATRVQPRHAPREPAFYTRPAHEPPRAVPAPPPPPPRPWWKFWTH
jgi:hypothetical protein